MYTDPKEQQAHEAGIQEGKRQAEIKARAATETPEQRTTGFVLAMIGIALGLYAFCNLA